MTAILRAVNKLFRRVFGEGTEVERSLRRRYGRMVQRQEGQDRGGRIARARLALTGEVTGRDFTVFRGKGEGDGRIGIFAKGACDLPAVFVLKPLLQERAGGVTAIVREGNVGEARSDILLQSLAGIPEEHYAETAAFLRLPDRYFRPTLFSPVVTVPGYPELGSFPKTVVVLSIAADLTRAVYRHREHGFLIDPGGAWLGREAEFFKDHEKARWIRQRFESLGRIPAEEFHSNMDRLISTIQRDPGAHVMVFNALTVEPEEWTHAYQYLPNAMARRRRDFAVALIDLSRKLDFSIIDVDRVLKRDGVKGQLDFAHFPLEKFQPIAEELYRVLREREVV